MSAPVIGRIPAALLSEAAGLLSTLVSLFVSAFAFCGVSAFSGVSGDRVSTIGAIEDVVVGVGVLMQVHVGIAVGVLMHELHVAVGVGVLEHMHVAA